jgi:hypothetical protein
MQYRQKVSLVSFSLKTKIEGGKDDEGIMERFTIWMLKS